MSHYHIDESDILFNINECPGFSDFADIEALSEFDRETAQMVFEQSKTFCQKMLAPLLASSDREGCHLKDGEVQVPKGVKEAWEEYRGLGFIGMNSDPAYGGSGMPHLLSVGPGELECGSFVAFSMLPLLTRGAARLILNFGSDALKDHYVERMFNGTWSGTMCLTEPHAGSDVGAGTTKAEPEGDHYRISGTKIFISWGEHGLTSNIVHLVLARIPGSPEGSKGLSLFVVPKYRTNDQGVITGSNDVSCGSIEHKMGINASPTCVINFGTNNQCIGYLLGEPGKGMRYMFQMMNEARIEVGVQGMAQASAAYLSAVNFAKERIQGRIADGVSQRPATIIEHPDVQRMLLRMRALVQGSRSLVYHLAVYLDLAHYHPSQAEKYGKLASLLTPICKSYCSDQGFRVTELAIQTYGGYGYCQEYPVEQYMRDSKISSIYEGTNGIQALDLVFRKILKDQGEALKIWIGEALALTKSLAESRLAPQAQALDETIGQAAATASALGKAYMAGNVKEIQFNATEFQEHLGHTLVAYFLLKQAKTADEALKHGPSGAQKTFYEQKIVTASYFCAEYLPKAKTALEVISAAAVGPVGLQAVFS